MKQDIEIIRGTTNTFNIEVKDADGAAYTLSSGEKLVFGVKANKQQADCDILKTLTANDITDSGAYALKLSPEDTADLPCGHYCYDVGLVSGEDYYCVIDCSRFVIKHSITDKEMLTEGTS